MLENEAIYGGNLETAGNNVKNAKKALYDYVAAGKAKKSALWRFTRDENFGLTYAPQIIASGGIPSAAQLKDNLTAEATNIFLKREYKYVKAIPEAERKEFNAKLVNVVDTARKWKIAANKLDKELTSIDKKIAANKESSMPLKEANKWAMDPINQRVIIAKVYHSVEAVNSKMVDVDQAASKLQAIKEDEKKMAIGGIIVAIVAVVLVIGGVVYCKCAKKCCFAEDKQMEGGERVIYKQEVKSKNSQKRHAKESLVPSFQVAEEQA